MSALVLVTLPIGNPDDITLRALNALKSGTEFFAEDTRVFKKWLEQLGISADEKMIDSFHDHSAQKIDLIIDKLKNGKTIYLVSDAGSPVISDPAFPLIRKALSENITIKTLPGVTSVITALELSGLPPHPFHFWGFIGRTQGDRNSFFQKLKEVQGTHIFFEAPHRIHETVLSFFEHYPDSEIVVTKELTKTYETVIRMKKEDLPLLQQKIVDKGEFVVLFHQEVSNHMVSNELEGLVRDYLEGKPSTKKLAKIFAKVLNEETKSIYDRLARSDK